MKKFCIFALVLIMLLSASAPALAAESYTGTVSPEAFLSAFSLLITGSTASGGSALTVVVKILLAIAAVVLAALFICAAALTALRIINTGKHMAKSKRRTEKPSVLYIIRCDKTVWALIAVVLVSLLLFILATSRCGKVSSGKAPEGSGSNAANTADSSGADDESADSGTTQIPGSGITGIGRSVIRPEMTSSSNPANWGIKWDIIENDKIVDSYNRSEEISFGNPEDYFALPGISAFRGDNYRSTATYGTASVTEKTISAEWYSATSALVNGWGTSSWTGSGWTGQPLIVQWDAETRQIMNLNSEKKNKDGLVEVVYATLDGHIYFLDLDDGQYTREPINVGMAFKGAGTLDPRGYPLLYVGSGDATVDGKRPRMFIISLIDGSVLYELGYDDAYALREDNDKWCGFDSSPLVDGKTDTLIWPGENGILYTIKLNTAYDKSAGTISVKPGDIVKTRYLPERASADKYWLGYEDSVSIIGSYMYLSENGGLFHCIDLNTMELIWTQDTKDDSNSTPPVEYDEKSGKYYLYTAPSLHWTANDDGSGSISIFKLDAENGDIIWEKAYPCHTVSGASGGVQASPVLGKAGTSIEGLIVYPIARTPNEYDGILVALDTQTGEEVWRLSMSNYAWSSPVAIYSDDGSAYLVLCDSGGTAFLIDGKTGEVLDSVSVDWLVEASPAVYNDTVVVGTRGQRIYALKVK